LVQVKVKVNKILFDQPELDEKGKAKVDGKGKIVMSDAVLYRKGDVFDIHDLARAEKLKRGGSVQIIGQVAESPGNAEIEFMKKQLAEKDAIIAGLKTPQPVVQGTAVQGTAASTGTSKK
jgi:hypothetical protein